MKVQRRFAFNRDRRSAMEGYLRRKPLRQRRRDVEAAGLFRCVACSALVWRRDLDEHRAEHAPYLVLFAHTREPLDEVQGDYKRLPVEERAKRRTTCQCGRPKNRGTHSCSTCKALHKAQAGKAG